MNAEDLGDICNFKFHWRFSSGSDSNSMIRSISSRWWEKDRFGKKKRINL